MKDAPTEFEVKFFPVNLDSMRASLKKAGASIKTPQRLMRRCVFSREANSGMECTYIRVRDEGNKVTLSAKQHAEDGKMSSQKEYETTVTDFATARQILLTAGLVQTGLQENKRETWQMPDGTLVELETWPKLPNYLEIEGATEKAVRETAKKLGLNWDEHILQSNDYLYAQFMNKERAVILKEMSYLSFEG